MKPKYIAAIAIVCLILAAGLAGTLYYLSLPPKEPSQPPVLSVSLDSFLAEATLNYSVAVSVQNTGGEAKGVFVTLESNAFGTVTSNSINVAANATEQVSCLIQVADIANGYYPISISYTYNGTTTPANISPTCYVLPSIEITNVHWTEPFGYPVVPEKSQIGQNDNTALHFEIKSNGHGAYSDFSATATAPSGTSGLTITPNFSSITGLGPLGQSTDYSFNLASHNVLPGKYVITITVLADGNEVTTHEVTLTVNA
ncbi:MAG: hypothetical protein ABSG33_07515 [Candidatus Bathyarchaeia archaeon]|jgi:hypothetical protein